MTTTTITMFTCNCCQSEWDTEDSRELRLVPAFCLLPKTLWYGYWTTELPLSDAGCPSCLDSNWNWHEADHERWND